MGSVPPSEVCASQAELPYRSKQPTQTKICESPVVFAKDECISSQLKDSAIRLQDATAPQTGPATSNKAVRGIWVLAYLGFFVIFLVQTIQLGKKYASYPTDISITIVSKPKLEFPAVTVCNKNPLRKSLVERLQSYQDLILLDQYVVSSVRRFAMGLNHSNIEGSILGNSSCPADSFACSTTLLCVPELWMCNDVDNCGDNSDETVPDCVAIKAGRKAELKETSNTTYIMDACAPGYIKCRDDKYVCAKKCDGQSECVADYWFDELTVAGCPEISCGGQLSASSTGWGSIVSPGYSGGRYTNNLNCIWVISAQEGEVVQVTLSEMQVEGKIGSCRDYLKFFDGEKVDNKAILRVNAKKLICGYAVPGTITSSKNKLTILFRSDETYTLKGFNLRYKSVAASSEASRRKRESVFEFSLVQEAALQKGHVEEWFPLDSEAETTGARMPETDKLRLQILERSRKSVGLSTESPGSDADYVYTADGQVGLANSVADYESSQQFDGSSGVFNVSTDSYFQIMQASTLPDYSDFRRAMLFEDDLLKEVGYQKEDFIVQCTFDGRKCSSKFFRTYPDSVYGNCFSFNSIRGKNTSEPILVRKTGKTGEEYGLKLTLFLDTQEYIGILAQDNGARVLINDPMVSGRVSAEGQSVSAGQVTFIGVKLNQVKRKGGKYSDCAETWPDSLWMIEEFKKEWPRYSRDRCLEICVTNQIARKCGCVNMKNPYISAKASFAGGYNTLCKITDKSQNECTYYVYSNYSEGIFTCDCPQPCLAWHYEQKTSSAPWPSEPYTPFLVAKLITSPSPRLRNYLSVMLNSANMDMEKVMSEMKKEFARVEVFFETLSFQTLKESPAYGVTDLFSDFGGNIGLWLGWSLLSVIEVVQFLYECFGIVFNRRC